MLTYADALLACSGGAPQAELVSAYAELLVSSNRTADAELLYRNLLSRASPHSSSSADLLHQYADLLLHEKNDSLAASRLYEAAANVDPSHFF